MPTRRRSWTLSPSQLAPASTRADLVVAARASTEHGVLSLNELRACGLTTQRVSIRVRNGRLHRLHPGVYAVGHEGLSPQGRWLAAVKACGEEAVLSHSSAGALWGFLRAAAVHLPDVSIPRQRRRRIVGVRVHRVAELRDDEWLVFDRIPVTTPVRTVIDLAAELDPARLRDALRRAVGQRRLRFGQLMHALSRAGPRPGMAQLRRLVADGVPTSSELEEIVLQLIRDGGFAAPDVNVPLNLGGRRVIPDFRWAAEQLVIEADGAAWHDNPIARAADIERQRLLEAHGETVLRVTWRQAIAEPARLQRRLREAGAPIVDAHPS